MAVDAAGELDVGAGKTWRWAAIWPMTSGGSTKTGGAGSIPTPPIRWRQTIPDLLLQHLAVHRVLRLFALEDPQDVLGGILRHPHHGLLGHAGDVRR